jgi:Ca-activated chloride channel family protein
VIKWAVPQNLYLLVSIPVLVLTLIISHLRSRRTLKKLSDESLIPQLTDSVDHTLRRLKWLFLVLGCGLLIVSAARPKWGEKPQVYRGRGIDVVIALDASKSMLSQDIEPNRLARAKTEIAVLLEGLMTNEVGITAFGGECYVMCPLTTDIDGAKLFLDIISPDVVPRPGTNLERAIMVSSSLFSPEEKTHKALIIFTDGDNLEGDPISAMQRVAEQGVKLFIVGIGTPEGSVIPELGAEGNFTGYKKDKEGKLVYSRLEERSLIVLARAADGRYFRAEGFYLDRLVDELEKIEKKELEEGRYVEYEERYQHFLLTAFFLILVGVFLNDRRGWRYFKIPLVFAFILTASSGFGDVSSKMREGNSLYEKERYEEALESYQEALVIEPDNPKIHYNMGRAFYQLEDYQETLSEFQLGLLSKDRDFQAWNFYNIGNTYFRGNQLDAAIEAYQRSLILNSADVEAKQNLEFCLKLKEEMEKQPESDSTSQERSEEEKQPQEQDEQQEEGEAQQQEERQPQTPELSEEEANLILQALESKEKENLKKSRETGEKRRVERDW